MRLDTYLMFDGQCEAAMNFYAQVLPARIEQLMRFGETPDAEHFPADVHHRIMHARLVIGDLAVMASDTPPEVPHEGFKGFSIALQVDSIAEAERAFAALADGGQVTMPLAQTFWAVRFGMLVDRFGVAWMVNCEHAG